MVAKLARMRVESEQRKCVQIVDSVTERLFFRSHLSLMVMVGLFIVDQIGLVVLFALDVVEQSEEKVRVGFGDANLAFR